MNERRITLERSSGFSQPINPIAVSSIEGEARWWFDSQAVINSSAAQTDGQMSIIEITAPPGSRALLLLNHREDEGFWILKGDAKFEVGDTTIEGHAGDFLLGPRDIPHRYTVGDNGCRMLFIMTRADSRIW
jgi:mannose-6-phosphate isomerase-like protein (cupin superfamily)